MKKRKNFEPKTTTDMKVFLLFLMDNLGTLLDHETIIEIVRENTNDISFDYDECLRQLAESEHLLYDELDGVRYYMISDKGRLVASELYDTLDEEFREKSLRLAIRHMSLSERGASIDCRITETDAKRYRVTMVASDRYGELMNTSLTVNSLHEAETIKRNFEAKSDSVYRGVFFAATGRLEYMFH